MCLLKAFTLGLENFKIPNTGQWYLNSWCRNFFFFHLFQSRFFHSFWAEPIIRWEKTGDPREKPPDHPQAELGLSPELGSNPQRWDDERFRSLKVSGLNHSAKGAAGWQIVIFFFFFFFAKVGGGTQTPEISKVRNSISYDSLDQVYLRAFLFSIREKKRKKVKPRTFVWRCTGEEVEGMGWG